MDKKFQLSVCPHDTAKFMIEWFQFNTYLQRKLGCNIHFEPQDNFLIEREKVLSGDFHIVYANPFSALAFIEQRGYIPIAKVIDLYDETILVVRSGKKGVLKLRPIHIASATDKLIVHTLGLNLLNQLHITRDQYKIHYVGNHMKVIQSIIKDEADLGFVFDETWYGLADSTKKELEVLAESIDRIAFHCFCIAPVWAERREEIQSILVGMSSDPKGRAILDAIHFKALEALSENSLDSLHELHTALEPLTKDAMDSLQELHSAYLAAHI